MTAEKLRAHVALNQARRRAVIWFWKPQWHWFGWMTLVPFMVGHDEYARRTIVIGWTITGRVIIPLWFCGSSDCLHEALNPAAASLNWYETHCPTCDSPEPVHTATCAVTK